MQITRLLVFCGDLLAAIDALKSVALAETGRDSVDLKMESTTEADTISERGQKCKCGTRQ